MTETFRAIRPKPDEFLPYYGTYINRVPDGDIVDTLSRQITETIAFFKSIPESKVDYQYAPGKWTIRQIMGHLSDGERVFQYRAFRFSRADATPVPGFEENDYVANAPFARVSMEKLIAEFEYLRRASIYMFSNLDAEAMGRVGVANGNPVSVRAIAFIMAGHELHHIQIVKDRYLK
jgi:hypothetical protein